MKGKQIIFGKELDDKIAEGLNITAEAVKTTMGPAGRNVMFENMADVPVVTKDGVSVAKSIMLKDRAANNAAKMVIAAAHQSVVEAGDGTTATTVLVQAIYNKAKSMIAAGHSATEIRKGIEIATAKLVEEVKASKFDLTTNEQIKHVATISANNNKELGELIAQAYDSVGADGVVNYERSPTKETYLHTEEGYQMATSYVSYAFADEPVEKFENPILIFCKNIIKSIRELEPLFQKLDPKTLNRQIIFIVNDVTKEPLEKLVEAKNAGAPIRVIKAPSFGKYRQDTIADIAAATGGVVVGRDTGYSFKAFTPDHIGTCGSIKVTPNTVTIFDPAGSKDAFKKRISEINLELKSLTEELDIEKAQERLARLTSGVATVFVGGNTDIEIRERVDLVDDALRSVQAATASGIVPGAGTALIKLRECLNELELTKAQEFGALAVYEAVGEPFSQILRNANLSPEVVLERIALKEFSYGFNVLSNEYGDLLEKGVIDPASVVTSALTNASATAGQLLSLGCMIYDDRKDDDQMSDNIM